MSDYLRNKTIKKEDWTYNQETKRYTLNLELEKQEDKFLNIYKKEDNNDSAYTITEVDYTYDKTSGNVLKLNSVFPFDGLLAFIRDTKNKVSTKSIVINDWVLDTTTNTYKYNFYKRGAVFISLEGIPKDNSLERNVIINVTTKNSKITLETIQPVKCSLVYFS